jgi:uncharacterized protein YcaQ
LKTPSTKISVAEARSLAIKSQGLSSPVFGRGKKGALAAIEHLGYIQIDTLSVASRSHHHVLWSRVPGYQEKHLHELLEKDRSIFEYWSHAASYLPMSEYRFSLPRKKEYADGGSHWFAQDKKVKKFVFDRIRAEGPLQSKDFEFKRQGPGNWYEWKPAKKALEQLFMEGKLMVAGRKGFQKVYDLAERVLPASVDLSFPSEKEYANFLIMKAVSSHGFAELKEISYLRKGMKPVIEKAAAQLLKEGKIEHLSIEGSKLIYLTMPGKLDELKAVPQDVNILSPFDNLVIQRKRLQQLFDFDYVIECYVPEAKRKYGYFCLPILHGDKFVARFDPKADRKEKVFHLKTTHFEKGFEPQQSFNKKFAAQLKKYAAFNGCSKVMIAKADKKWKKEMNDLLK